MQMQAFQHSQQVPGARQPKGLFRETSVERPMLTRVRWNVDSKILDKKDRELASSTFDGPVTETSPAVAFRMILKPKALDQYKDGSCFASAKGRGYIELRCLQPKPVHCC